MPAGALLLAAVTVLSACAPAIRPARPVATPVAPAPPAGAAYQVVPARSEVRILAWRDGPLARLGHNHVLVSHELEGELSMADGLERVRFELRLPVTTLVLDEPAARREEGAEFASEPSAADVAGTRRNLLGPAVLDAEHYPRLRVAGVGAVPETEPGAGRYRVRLRIELRGQATELEVPVTVAIAEDELAAAGEFRVAQSFLGLTPFSIALGALRVADELLVRVHIVARRDR